MKLNFFKLNLFLIGFISTTFHISSSMDKRWLTYLLKNIKSIQVHQVLLLYDQGNSNVDCTVGSIIQRIAEEIPTLKLTVEVTNPKSNEFNLIPAFYDVRSTTLIVLIDASGSKQLLTKLRNPIGFLTRLSEARNRPNCLLIFLKTYKESTYVKILRQMWSNAFLDTTLLEVTGKKHYEIATAKMYSFNPFTDIMKRQTYKEKSNLFPGKSRNLYGYPIKVDLFNQPPVAYVSRNLTGHVENVFGPDVSITKVISKAMNFKILWIASNDTFWEISRCAKNESTGALYRLMNKEVQFFATQTARSATCIMNLFEWSACTKMLSLVIVVPYIVDESIKISSEWRLLNVLIVISFLLLTWIVTRAMQFNQHNWRFPHLIQIMLGLGAPLEPQRLVERIILGSMLLTCLLNSTFIYTAFTEVILQKESKQILETIEDVTASRFKLKLNPVFKFYIYNFTEGSSRLLLDKANVVNITVKECLDELIQKKNIACIVSDYVADMLVQHQGNGLGQPLVTIVKEYFMTMATGFPLEAASPFVTQINDILLRLAATGVLEKIQGHYFNISVISQVTQDLVEEEKNQSSQVRRQLIILLVVGYLSSFFAFLCELLVSFFLKRAY